MKFLIFFFLPAFLFAEPSHKTGLFEENMKSAGLFDVNTLSASILLDFRYASENNFLKQNVYGDLKKCYLHKEAAEKLALAQKYLEEIKPGFKLYVFDCARPRSVQYKMWELVKGTPQQGYVANPSRGSIHNFGCAVDLSLADETGKEIDMGTPYDFFGDLAQPVLEKKFLKEKKLTPGQIQNRELLRTVMKKAGFNGIANEWWHFEAFPKEVVFKKYKIIE